MSSRFIHKNKEIYSVMCNSNLDLSKSMKCTCITLEIYTLMVSRILL